MCCAAKMNTNFTLRYKSPGLQSDHSHVAISSESGVFCELFYEEAFYLINYLIKYDKLLTYLLLRLRENVNEERKKSCCFSDCKRSCVQFSIRILLLVGKKIK